MLVLCTVLISYFYILFLASNLWNKINIYTPSWGDSKSLIYILLIFYIILNIYLLNILISKFYNLYLYIFTILSVGYIYTLYNCNLKESLVLSILLCLYNLFLFYNYSETKSVIALCIIIIIYLTLWTKELKENIV